MTTRNTKRKSETFGAICAVIVITSFRRDVAISLDLLVEENFDLIVWDKKVNLSKEKKQIP